VTYCDFNNKTKTCSQNSKGLTNKDNCQWHDVGGMCGCFVSRKLIKINKKEEKYAAR
jgi:hypothetical protein